MHPDDQIDQITYIQCAQQILNPVMSAKRHDLPVEPDKIKSYIVPVSNMEMLSLIQIFKE